MTNKKYITLQEAADILSTTKRQIVSMINLGKLTAKDINASKGQRHTWRVLLTDVLPSDNNDSNK